MKKLFITLILAFAFILQSQAQELTFKIIQEVANSITEASCPVMIDNDTRFDKCSALQNENGGIVIQYNYTLVNVLREDFTVSQIEAIKSSMETKLAKSIRSSEAMDVIRQNKVIVSYLYYDKNHIIFMLIKITPDKYMEDSSLKM
jgi:hypothetical protein